MLITKCTEEFHRKYEKYSSKDTVKGLEMQSEPIVEEPAEPQQPAEHPEEVAPEGAPSSEPNQEEISIGFKDVQANDDDYADEEEYPKYKQKRVLKSSRNKKKKKYDEYTDVKDSIYKTEKTIAFIKRSFEKLDFGSDDLIEVVLDKYSMKKSKELKEENRAFYDKGMAYLKETYPNEKREFYEMNFEDIVFIICSIVKFYMGMSIKLELGDIPTNLMMIFYGNESQFNNLAAMFGYELQLKPYASKYEYYREEYEKSKDQKMYLLANSGNEESETQQEQGPLLVNELKKTSPLQFEDLDINKAYYWPPYMEYSQVRDVKYRRYERDDLYHECSFEDNDEQYCGKCSKFRNIDKLRLLFDSLDKCLKITFMKKKGFIITILYKRNYDSYGDKIGFKGLLSNAWNIFDPRKFNYLINLIRNYYGEVISYYFLWMEHYIQWLLFPSVLGIIVAILAYTNPFSKKTLGKSPITVLDIFLLVFCFVVSIWATLLLKIWTQKEQLYRYIWGTENYSHNEPDSELFDPDSEVEFVFGKKITMASSLVRNTKKFISYLVLLIMICSTCALTFLLFHYKKLHLKEDTKENYWFNTCVGMGYAAINAIQIKIFNFIYTFLAEKLNKWENYKKDYQRLNDLAVKIIIFDFMNCYSACFYIGFYKPAVGEECVGTCVQEIGTQLYTTLLINFGLNIVEIGLPFLMYKFREYTFKKQAKHAEDIAEIRTHSVVHQMLCDELNNTIYEYNEMIILFGYVCLFSVTAPLTPLIVLILVWTEKLSDLFKFFFLERIQILDQATGIEIYYKLMKVLMFVGMITNAGVLLFSKELKLNNDMVYKIGIFLGIENLILILMFFLDWKVFPFWWKELSDLKELYDKKYFRRKGKNLPHYYLQIMQKKEQYKKKTTINKI